MTKKRFEEAFVKFRKLVTENGFDLDINTQSKDITMTIRNPIDAVEQTSFIDVEEDKSSYDASISFVFKDGEVLLNTTGKLYISESLVNKLKNQAKNLHYPYLWEYREERMESSNRLIESN